MALSATMRRFEINLSDVDRGVYETLELRAAQHPSETDLYLVTRLLAYCLEYGEGIDFGRGVSTPDDPTIAIFDLTGQILLWIEIGQPAPERLHKIAKLAGQVAVYTHKDPAPTLSDLESGQIHRAETIALVAFAPEFIAQLAEKLDRTNRWDVLRSEGMLYITVGDATLSTRVGVLRDPR